MDLGPPFTTPFYYDQSQTAISWFSHSTNANNATSR